MRLEEATLYDRACANEVCTSSEATSFTKKGGVDVASIVDGEAVLFGHGKNAPFQRRQPRKAAKIRLRHKIEERCCIDWRYYSKGAARVCAFSMICYCFRHVF